MSASASLSTHVLDTRTGRPAMGLKVALQRIAGGQTTAIAERRTDDDGRVRDLAANLEPGTYRLSFDVGEYFAADRGLFGAVCFDLVLGAGHHHVPLLVSPFACISYRGS
jgi:5-hydroxyisourate hydrolase